MKQWIPACAGMTVLKEINIKHRRHPRAGGNRDHKNKTLCRYDDAYVLYFWYATTGGVPVDVFYVE